MQNYNFFSFSASYSSFFIVICPANLVVSRTKPIFAAKITLLSVLGLITVFGVLTWLEFRPLINGALSAEKIDDGLYYMEYKGDDGFDALMAKGGFESADLMAGDTIQTQQLTEAIKAVSQPEREGFLGTAWTMVMDLKHPSVTYYSRRHFDKPLHFEMK